MTKARILTISGVIGGLAILSLVLYYLLFHGADPFRYHLECGIACEREGDNILAAEEYREALKHNPAGEEAHIRLGDLLLSEGDLDAAEYHFIKAIQVYDDSPFGNLGLGRVYMQKGNLKLARMYINLAFVKGRELPQVLMHWADLMERLSKPDSAEIFYKRALDRATYKARLANTLGNFYIKNGEIDSAKVYFARTLEADSNYITARVNLANLKLDSGDTATAVDDYLAILAIDPDLIQVNLNLAVVYFKRQKYDRALEYARKAVEIDSTYTPAQRLLKMLEE